MENKNKKCCSKGHGEIDAIDYCQKCNIYLCNECINIHSKLLGIHHIFNLSEDIKEDFACLCKEKNYGNTLNYFCKTHNILCCASCINKIQEKEKGQHNNCDICKIEDIKKEKKNILLKNIQLLENLSKTFEESNQNLIKTLKKINN